MAAKIDLEKGVEEVLLSLLDDKSIKWIQDSALTERAFLIGANKFAEAIFPDQESKALGLALMGTLWARERDDPFPSSEAGKLYSELRHRIESYCDSVIRGGSGFDCPEEALNKIIVLVDGLLEKNRSAYDACRRSCAQISRWLLEIENTQTPNEEAINGIFGNLSSLEEPLRFLNGNQSPEG